MPRQSLSPVEEVGKKLGCLATLTDLDLSGAFCIEGEPIDVALQHLTHLPGLRKLNLADTSISLAGFEIIGQITVSLCADLLHFSGLSNKFMCVQIKLTCSKPSRST